MKKFYLFVALLCIAFASAFLPGIPVPGNPGMCSNSLHSYFGLQLPGAEDRLTGTAAQHIAGEIHAGWRHIFYNDNQIFKEKIIINK